MLPRMTQAHARRGQRSPGLIWSNDFIVSRINDEDVGTRIRQAFRNRQRHVRQVQASFDQSRDLVLELAVFTIQGWTRSASVGLTTVLVRKSSSPVGPRAGDVPLNRRNMLCRGKTKCRRRYTSQPKVHAPALPKPLSLQTPMEHWFQSVIPGSARVISLQTPTTVPFPSAGGSLLPFCRELTSL